MMFVTGIVLFALAILISVALHECGHMWVARRTGMKVRRYFVGFGPTLWSTRRGETEYGVKAVPLGGFCDIAGMTPVEELDPDERDRAMYKQATWKRVAVLFAGPGMNLAICLVLIYAIALVWGLPNLHPPTRAVIGETGHRGVTDLDHDVTGANSGQRRRTGPVRYGVFSAMPATFAVTGDLTVEVGKALAALPTKVGALVRAIGGGQRDPQTPISVVGASIIGGDTVDHGLWVAFWFFLAQLNLILAAINLLPLLPFDGGHIAVAVFERIRNMVRSARGKVAAAPVNYLKLLPATYVVLVLVVGYMLLTVTADLVNPIRLFQ